MLVTEIRAGDILRLEGSIADSVLVRVLSVDFEREMADIEYFIANRAFGKSRIRAVLFDVLASWARIRRVGEEDWLLAVIEGRFDAGE